MCGLLCIIAIQFIYTTRILASLGDIMVLVTDKTDDLAGNIHKINMTSQLITTLPSFKVIRPVAIDYDVITDRIYWSDVMCKEIRTSRLDGSNEKTFIHMDTAAIADGISIDSRNRSLFYTDTGNDVIVRVSLDSPLNRTIIINRDLEKPRGIIAYPKRQKVIWTDWSGWASIQLCDYDGNNRKTLVSADIQWPNGITLDKDSETIYWCDAGKDRIESIKLDGTQRTIILTETNTHYFSVFFFERYLYLTDWNTDYVRQLNLTGNEVSKVTSTRFHKLTGIFVLRVSRCPDGSYGDECTSKCGHCKEEGVPCDKFTGLCMAGCEQGYYGNCTDEICDDFSETASLCDLQCQCDVDCQSGSVNCHQGCDNEWYKATCEKLGGALATSGLTESVTHSSTSKGKTMTTASTNIYKPKPTVFSSYRPPLGGESQPRVGGVSHRKSEKTSALAGLSFTVAALLIISVVLGIYVYKYRQDSLRLKTYDHLRPRDSVSTTVTRYSHDYTHVDESAFVAPTSRKVCPDILLNDPPQTMEEGLLDMSIVDILKEEPRYVSLGSLCNEKPQTS